MLKSMDDAMREQMHGLLKSIMKLNDARLYFNAPVDWRKLKLLQYPEIIKEPMDLGTIQAKMDAEEIVLAGKLIAGAAAGVSDSNYRHLLQETSHSRWVHLYLGAIHLDAIRRRLRGENVRALLNKLRTRSSAVDHRLYTALSRGSRWGH